MVTKLVIHVNIPAGSLILIRNLILVALCQTKLSFDPNLKKAFEIKVSFKVVLVNILKSLKSSLWYKKKKFTDLEVQMRSIFNK